MALFSPHLELEILEALRREAEKSFAAASPGKEKDDLGEWCDDLSDKIGPLKRAIEDRESALAMEEGNRERAYGRTMTS